MNLNNGNTCERNGDEYKGLSKREDIRVAGVVGMSDHIIQREFQNDYNKCRFYVNA